MKSRNKGITLMALVVTVIVLLILAAITISTISGNSIITSTINAKEQAEINSEIKVIGTASNQAKNMNKYGDLEEEQFVNALNSNTGKGKTIVKYYEKQKMFSVTFRNSSRTYQVFTNGNVKYLGKLGNAIIISADPSGSISLRERYDVNITIERISDDDSVQNNISSIKYLWTDSEEEPQAEKFTSDNSATMVTPDGESEKVKTTETPITISKDDKPEGTYYLHIQVTKEDGEIVTETFGPYELGIAEVQLAVDPNGGKWRDSTNIQKVDGKENETVEIQDPQPQQKFTVKFDTGASVEANVAFVEWNLKDYGTITKPQDGKSIYTFGTGAGKIIAQYTVEGIELPNANKEGNEIEGWYKGNTPVGKPGEIYVPTYNKDGEETLTAKWKVNKYEVTYDYSTNGGTKINYTDEQSARFVEYGKKVDLTKATAVKDGYTFVGWNTNKDATTAQTSDITMTTEGVKVYAIFQKQITLTFKDAQGEKHGVPHPVTIWNNNKGSATAPKISEYDGWTLRYWTTSEEPNGIETVASEGTISNIEKNTNYYARYTKQITVSFNLNGGTGANTLTNQTGNIEVNSKDLDNIKGASIKMPNVTPTKEGYGFNGWNTKADGTGTHVDKDKSGEFKGDTTLYAEWVENTYIISFNNNDGKGTMTSITGVKFSESKKLTKNSFTREGYVFKGWSKTKNGTKEYNDEATVSKLSSTNGATVTLFAVWADETGPTITADDTIIYGETLSIRLQDTISGVSAWQVSTSNTEPTNGWTEITNTKDITVTKTGLGIGTYYIWAKDASGNTLSKQVTVTKKKITAPTANTGLIYTGIVQTGVASGDGYTVTEGEKIDAGSYTAKLVLKDKTNTTWSDGTTEDKTVTWSIAKKKITVEWNETASFTYNGNNQGPTLKNTQVNGVGNEKINLEVEGQKKDVGTNYTATAKISSVTGGQANKDNYELTGDTKTFNITNASITGTLTITGTNTYGSKLTANIEGLNPSDANLTYQWYSNSNNSTTGGTPIEGAKGKEYTVGEGLVGKYIYVIVTASKENFEDKTFKDITDSENNTTEKVEAKKITAPTANTGLTYTGKEQEGIASGEGYELKDGAKTDAGKYNAILELSDKENTVWSDGTTTNKTVSWSIAKKQVAVEWKEPYTWIYDGTSHIPSLKNTQINGVNSEKINLTTTGAGTVVGRYTATASISSVTGGQANKNNYELTGDKKAFEITEAVISGNVKIEGKATYGEKLTAKVENLTPSDANLKYQWFSSDTKSTTGGTALTEITTNNTYTVGKGLVGKYIYVIVTASKENFEDKTFEDITDSENNTTEKVEAKKITKPTAKAGLVYTGLEQTGVTGSGDYTVTDGAKTDAGDYTAVATLKDKKNTVWADTNNTTDKSIDWSIAKKEISVEWNNDTSFVYNGNEQGPTLKNTQVNGVNNEKINLRVDGKEKDAGNHTATANINSVTGGQANNNNYKLTGNTKSYEIAKAENTLDVTPKTVYTETTLNLAEQVKNAIGTVTYEIKTNGTTTDSSISGSNLTLGAMNIANDDDQTVVITVKAGGDKNHKDASKELSITVQKYTRTITFTKPTTDKLAYNATTTAEVSITGEGGIQGAVSYVSNNTEVITCSGTNGATLKAVKGTGEATITATLARTTTVKQATATKKIIAQKIANTLSVTNKTVKTGKTIDLAEQVSDAKGDVHYAIKTNGTTTASTLNGKNLTAGAMNASNDNNQTVVITVTADGNDNYESVSKELTITVEKYTRTIKFAESVPDSIKLNGTATASVDITGEGGTQGGVTYTSSNTNVIIVNGTTLKAVASSGKSTITATMARTTTVKQATATKEIEAGKDSNRMEVSQTELTVKTLSVTDLSTLVSKADGTVTYTIKTNGTTSESTINGSKLTAGAMNTANDNDQTVVVTIKASGTNDYGEKSVDVTITVQKYTRTISFKNTVPSEIEYNKTATAAVHIAGEGGTQGSVTYTTSNANIIAVNGTTLTAKASSGEATITATMARTATVKEAKTTKKIKGIQNKTNPMTISSTSMTVKTLSVTDLSTLVSKAEGTVTYAIKTNGTTSESTINGSKLTAGAMSANDDNDQTVVLTITAGGNANYAAKSVDVTLTVEKYTRNIAFTKPTSDKLTYNSETKAEASITGEGGTANTTVTFTSGTTNVITCSGTNGATLKAVKGTGSSTITATLGRTTTVKEAKATKNITAQKAENTITAKNSTVKVLSETVITTFVKDNVGGALTGTILANSDNEGGATKGAMTTSNTKFKAGTLSATDDTSKTVKLAITSAATDNYNAKTVEVTITVEKYTRTLAFTKPTTDKLAYNATTTAEASITGEGGTANTTVIFTSGTTSVITCSGTNGATLKAVKGTGNSVITATLTGTETVAKATTTKTITAQKIENTMTAKNSAVKVLSETAITSFVKDNVGGALTGTIVANSDNEGGATKGAMTTSNTKFKAGTLSATDDTSKTVKLSITSSATDNYNAKTVEVTITVEKYTRTLAFTKPTTDKLAYNATTTAEASITGEGGTANTTVTFTSGTTSVITCSGTNGATLKAVKGTGNSVITATLAGTETVAKATTTKTITAQKIANTLSVTNKTVKTGKTIDLAEQVSDAKGDVHYAIKTNGTTTASSINGSSLTLGAMNASNDNNQTVVITVTADGNDNYASASKELTITVEKYTRTIKFAESVPDSIKLNGTATAKVDVTGEGGTQGGVTYTSSNTNVIIVNGTTLKAVASSGKSTITATMARTTTVKQATATKEIEAGKDSNRMEVSQTELTVKTLSVTDLSTLVSKADGTVTYTIKTNGTTSASSISGSNFTAGAMNTANDNDQTVVVTIKASGTNDYGEKSVDVTITVQKYTATINWDSTTPSSVTYGDNSKKATATATVSGGTLGAITYISENTSAITINSTTGALTVVNGNSKSSVITATLARTTTVKAGTKTTTITTKKATNPIKVSNITVYAGSTGNDLSAKVSDAQGTVTYTKSTDGTTSSGSSVNSTTGAFTAGVLSTSNDNNATVTVTVTAGGNDNYASGTKTITVTVQKYTNALTFTAPTNTTLVYGKTTTVTATPEKNGGTNGAITYTSGTTSVISINGTTIKAEKGTGSSVITASMAGTATVKSATKTIKINVARANATNSVKITGTNTQGQELTANVSTNSDGDKTYQWWTSDSDTATSGSIINGATGEKYTVGAGLVGKYIGVTVNIAEGTNWKAASPATDITDDSNNSTGKSAYVVTYEKGANVKTIGTTTAKTTTGKVILPSITAEDGYTATGWYNGDTKVGNAGAEVTITGNVTLTAKAEDETKPTVTVTRKTYNSFDWTASDGVGITGWQVTTSDSKPSATGSGWTTSGTLTSGTYTNVSTTEAKTYYFWAKDSAGNVNDAGSTTSIANHKITLTAGAGTTLTAKADTTNGAIVTDGMYVLDGTPVYPTGELSAGYNTLVIKKGSTTITNGSKQTISEDTTFTTSATANTVTINVKNGSEVNSTQYKVSLSTSNSSDTAMMTSTNLNGTARFYAVPNGTYYIWAKPHNINIADNIYSGQSVIVSDNSPSAVTIQYYELTVISGTGISLIRNDSV